MDSYLIYIIGNEMLKHAVQAHQDEPVLITIPANSEKVIDGTNDFNFFVNAFTNAGIANGRINGSGGGNAMDISPMTINSKIFKFQMFKGEIKIQNFDPLNTLYVELMRVTPVPDQI